MEALITLYTRATGIEAEKLQMIEDIESYLTIKEPSAPTYTIQYQKIRLNMFVKIILNEQYSSPLQANNYTYVKITNKDNLTKHFYFFIKSLNWKAKECIELELVMDTLNSFKMGTDYTFSPKTIIQRQHKDRMKHVAEADFTINSYSFDDIEPSMTPNVKYAITNPNYMDEFLDFLWNERHFFKDVDEPTLVKISLYKADKTPIIIDFPCYAIWGTDLVEDIPTSIVLYGELEDKKFPIDRTMMVSFEFTEYFPYIEYEHSQGYFYNFIDENEEQTFNFCYTLTSVLTNVSGYIGNVKVVDLMSEELNPQLYGGEITKIQDKKSNNQSWYLVYKTTTSDVVRAYLVPENTTRITYNSPSPHGFTINPTMLESGKSYKILLSKPSGWVGSYYEYGKENFTYDLGQPLPTPQHSDTYGEGWLLEFWKQGTQIMLRVWNGGVGTYSTQVLYEETIAVSQISYIGNENVLVYGKNDFFLYSQVVVPENYISGFNWDTNINYVELSPIDNLNRTDSTLIKVIKMPYVPYDFDVDENGYLILDNSFTLTSDLYLTNVLLLNDLNLDLRNPLDTNNTIKSPIEEFMRITSLPSLLINRDDTLESKMLHSEFFTPKFTYDSFSFIYQLELVDIDKWISENAYSTAYLSTRFVMTRTINSRFAFEFTDYEVALKTDDYPNWLVIARNNEEVIYNSAYLNYIKSGYNYDVKNKQAQATRNWVSIGANVLTAVVGIVGSIATGGASVPLAIMGVSGIISTSATITNAISTQAQNERSIQEKLDTLKLQTASVSGSDDVDLMTRYNGNRLLYLIYKVNTRVDKLLKDLFYYYGYKDNVSGIPSMNTRYWFNHLKCEPILEFTSINMTQEIEDELKGIMRNGFTYYHKQMVNGNKTWDIDQVKENWEVSMLPYLN